MPVGGSSVGLQIATYVSQPKGPTTEQRSRPSHAAAWVFRMNGSSPSGGRTSPECAWLLLLTCACHQCQARKYSLAQSSFCSGVPTRITTSISLKSMGPSDGKSGQTYAWMFNMTKMPQTPRFNCGTVQVPRCKCLTSGLARTGASGRSTLLDIQECA